MYIRFFVKDKDPDTVKLVLDEAEIKKAIMEFLNTNYDTKVTINDIDISIVKQGKFEKMKVDSIFAEIDLPSIANVAFLFKDAQETECQQNSTQTKSSRSVSV